MEILIKLLQVILSLSILVVLHEGGHFLPAKWFKTRVEKFYLFFNPGFELFKKKIGETEYGIGWLPFGGYVKISGMIDESFDKEQMAGEPQPWEFRSKPAWQRFIIMIGGVTVNLILGVLLFIMIFAVYGEKYIPAENVKYGIYVDSLGYDVGLRTGDVILKYGDKSFDKFSRGAIISDVVLNGTNTITVDRNGEMVSIPVDPKYVGIFGSQKMKQMLFFDARTPFEITEVTKGTKKFGLFKKGEDGPAAKAGIEAGDKIVSIGGRTFDFYDEAIKITKEFGGQEVPVVIERAGQQMTKQVALTKEGKMGVVRQPLNYFYGQETQDYTWGEAVPAGWNKSVKFLGDQLKAFKKMFSGELKVTESLGSLISIGNLFPSKWDWSAFWNLTAMLSLILGIMNLLPIPALDGGYIVFLIWEMVSGKKVSDKTMEIANTIGFFILIGLMIFALGLDVSRII